jgi:hypothetical protein
LIFNNGKQQGRDASPGQGKRRKHGQFGANANPVERLSSSFKKRDRKIDDPYEIAGNIVIENMSVNSLNSGYIMNVQRELDPYANYDDDSNQVDRCKVSRPIIVIDPQSLQDRNSLDDLLSQNAETLYDHQPKVFAGGLGFNKGNKKAHLNMSPHGLQNSMI